MLPKPRWLGRRSKPQHTSWQSLKKVTKKIILMTVYKRKVTSTCPTPFLFLNTFDGLAVLMPLSPVPPLSSLCLLTMALPQFWFPVNLLAKTMGYNLLNPPDPTLNRKTPVTSSYERHKAEHHSIKTGQQKAQKIWNLIHLELQMLFNENPECFDMDAYTMGPACIIAAVQTWITELTSLAKLQHLDKSFKSSSKITSLQTFPMYATCQPTYTITLN